jgi:hypothetical protein
MLQKTKDWIMYYEVKRLLKQGRSERQIAEALGLHRQTVKKYRQMNEDEFAQFESCKELKTKMLDSYETFVRDRLVAAPAATTSQVHDWLKEHYPGFKPVSAKTVYSFVMYVRQKYQILIESGLFLVDENLGDLMLTQEFKSYTKEQHFELHFCRKSDPESKGKVESAVKYVKSNFLYGRIYHDLETLQQEVIGWLERTGNGVAHSVTRKIPLLEWEKEKPHLAPWYPVVIEPSRYQNAVRKDNAVPYRGNSYSVPQGTYKKGVRVRLTEVEGELHIYDTDDKLLCKHVIPEGKGHSVLNNNHKRDRSLKIAQLITEATMLFQDSTGARTFLEQIRKEKPRYIRDHVHAITTAIRDMDPAIVSQTLDRCMEQGYYSATMFKELLQFNRKEAELTDDNAAESKIVLMDPNSAKKAAIQPDKSNLDTYDSAF